MDDPLNAFFDAELRLDGAPGGPLAGTIFAAKDLFDVAGHVTGAGSPDWLRTHRPATATSPVIESLLAAGAALRGKTHTDEMAFSLNGSNAHYGTPVNPNAPGRLCGGSSSGSAAATAGGLVDFALGTDTGGSVRIPANHCGLYGIRPSHGAISTESLFPLAPGFDTVGWMARDAELFEAVGKVLLGGARVPAPGRLLIAGDALALAEAEARDALVGPLAALGPADTVEVFPGPPEHWLEVFRTLQMGEVGAVHGDWVRATGPDFGPGVDGRFAASLAITEADLLPAREERRRFRGHMEELLAGGAMLAMPTAMGPAPRTDISGQELDTYRSCTLTLTCVAGLAGLPQVSLPLAEVDGLPLGLSLLAAPGNDAMLLAAIPASR